MFYVYGRFQLHLPSSGRAVVTGVVLVSIFIAQRLQNPPGCRFASTFADAAVRGATAFHQPTSHEHHPPAPFSAFVFVYICRRELHGRHSHENH